MYSSYINWYNTVIDKCEYIMQILTTTTIDNNSVVVFDIDDTLINNSGQLILPIFNIYKKILNMNIKIIIITNRLGIEKIIEYTKKKELIRNNLLGYKCIYFRCPTKKNDPFLYKKKARKNIHERGMKVIMSVGDNQCDIGEYGGIGIIIPKLKLFY